MRSTWKDILYPGTVQVRGQTYTFTPEDLRNAERVGNDRLREYFVPVCWEHDPAAVPLGLSAAAQRARSVVGGVGSYRVDSRGVLQARIDVDRDADADAMNRARFVSPLVHWDWVGEDGRKWPGLTVQHVAATPVPVQSKQQPISLSRGSTVGPIYLSLSDYKEPPVAEENETTTEEAPGTGGKDYFKEAMEHLKNKGVNLPEDTNPENAWERIVVACMQGDDVAMDETPEPEDDQVEVSTQPAPIGLSQAERSSLARAEKLTRKELLGRIDAAFAAGKITPTVAKKLKNEASSVKLSFGEDGELKPNPVTHKLAIVEDLVAHSAWSKQAQLSQSAEVQEVAPPYNSDDDEAFQKAWSSTGKR